MFSTFANLGLDCDSNIIYFFNKTYVETLDMSLAVNPYLLDN